MNAASIAPTQTGTASFNRKAAWLIIFLLTVMALVIVAVPVWLIMPFKSQTPRGLDIAYTMKRWSPLVTVAASIIVLALAVFLWRGVRRWWLKVPLVIAFAFTLVFAWFARQNHFEWMFNPLPNVSFAKASDASFVADNDQVLGVHINGEAAAYPIRQIAYHHVIQDEVGGVAIAATY